MVRTTPYVLQANDEFTLREVLEEIPNQITTVSTAEANPSLEVSQATADKRPQYAEAMLFDKFLSRFGRSQILSYENKSGCPG